MNDIVSPNIDLSGILPKGWTVVGEIGPAILTSAIELETICVHQHDEIELVGEELVHRAPEHEADLGFADAKICYEQREKIPASCSDHPAIVVFPKAIALDLDQRRCVLCLVRYSDWSIHYGGLSEIDWYRGCKLGRRRKSVV